MYMYLSGARRCQSREGRGDVAIWREKRKEKKEHGGGKVGLHLCSCAIEPGGYLQWEEGDVASLHNKVPADQITTVQQQQQRHRACDRFNEHWNEWCRKVGLEYG